MPLYFSVLRSSPVFSVTGTSIILYHRIPDVDVPLMPDSANPIVSVP